MTTKTSRISGFFKRTLHERAAFIADWAGLSEDQVQALSGDGGLTSQQADHMVENAVGVYALPLGIATNFTINGQDVLVPMVVEEPSVIAACSFAAKLARAGGGFTTSSDEPVMIGQLQVLDVTDLEAAASAILAHKSELLALADSVGGSIIRLGGGARDIVVRPFPDTAIGPMLVIHLLFDTRDAMGANAINTAVELIAPQVEAITGGRVNLRILSNLTDQRKARAECRVPAAELATESLTGPQVVDAVVEAAVFAEVDPYRATTHNKGVMNGIDAVIIATGNDWRAIEAGAHAWAARDGRYTSLTRWWKDETGDLRGSIELPLAVGIIGGATRVHPAAQVALKLMDIRSTRQLAEICAAVGLAQNMAAIRALATDGIQSGHMRMHARQIAVAAGAEDGQIAQVVQQMISEKNIRLERAKAIVDMLKGL
ncbi:MAG: hydroxymethylglutaryl-CoA reductase, degradative [Pleurocapsa minor GSE-CHR-MK-17-07R]|jgi:hydroxymethylglutaryl-CoA reductase|nr:hydroxymethylglutaryl-CoA reductase, degradative [Pleurocapsa minor GSE-CHR-MK 17-07R]